MESAYFCQALSRWKITVDNAVREGMVHRMAPKERVYAVLRGLSYAGDAWMLIDVRKGR